MVMDPYFPDCLVILSSLNNSGTKNCLTLLRFVEQFGLQLWNRVRTAAGLRMGWAHCGAISWMDDDPTTAASPRPAWSSWPVPGMGGGGASPQRTHYHYPPSPRPRRCGGQHSRTTSARGPMICLGRGARVWDDDVHHAHRVLREPITHPPPMCIPQGPNAGACCTDAAQPAADSEGVRSTPALTPCAKDTVF